MDRDDLNLAYAAADEEGDDRRLDELQRAERDREIDDLDYKYLDSEGSDDGGDTGAQNLQNRAERAASMAQAVGNDDLADSLQTVASADRPERVLRQEIAVAQDRSPENVDALRELAEGDG
jgi:hypothetical protein